MDEQSGDGRTLLASTSFEEGAQHCLGICYTTTTSQNALRPISTAAPKEKLTDSEGNLGLDDVDGGKEGSDLVLLGLLELLPRGESGLGFLLLLLLAPKKKNDVSSSRAQLSGAQINLDGTTSNPSPTGSRLLPCVILARLPLPVPPPHLPPIPRATPKFSSKSGPSASRRGLTAGKNLTISLFFPLASAWDWRILTCAWTLVDLFLFLCTQGQG